MWIQSLGWEDFYLESKTFLDLTINLTGLWFLCYLLITFLIIFLTRNICSEKVCRWSTLKSLQVSDFNFILPFNSNASWTQHKLVLLWSHSLSCGWKPMNSPKWLFSDLLLLFLSSNSNVSCSVISDFVSPLRFQFNKYLLSPYCVLSTSLGAVDIGESVYWVHSPPLDLYVLCFPQLPAKGAPFSSRANA